VGRRALCLCRPGTSVWHINRCMTQLYRQLCACACLVGWQAACWLGGGWLVFAVRGASNDDDMLQFMSCEKRVVTHRRYQRGGKKLNDPHSASSVSLVCFSSFFAVVHPARSTPLRQSRWHHAAQRSPGHVRPHWRLLLWDGRHVSLAPACVCRERALAQTLTAGANIANTPHACAGT